MSRVAYPFVERSVVASNLRRAVNQSALSARAIAEQAKVQPPHLSRFLKTGAGINPDGIERVARVIGVDVRTLYSSAL